MKVPILFPKLKYPDEDDAFEYNKKVIADNKKLWEKYKNVMDR